MRIVKVASYYGVYVRSFYRSHRGLQNRSYQEQLSAILRDCFSWADFFGAPLAKHGYETLEIIRDAEPLQRQWAREHGLTADLKLEEITAAQIRDARPDVLWFEDSSDGPVTILQCLEHSGFRPPLVLGWTGSFIPNTEAFQKFDLTLSCAPETVEYLAARGARAEHLDHAFSPLVLERMKAPSTSQDVAFFGNIHRLDGFHRDRATVLESIVTAGRAVRIYTPQLTAGTSNPILLAFRVLKFMSLYPAKLAVYAIAHVLAAAGVPPRLLKRNRSFRRAFELDGPPKALPQPNELPSRLLHHAVRPVFGLDMYTAIAASRVVLNVHADSSPRFASNMRLFEVTGAGSLLLSDWRPNLPKLFEPDFEMVAYRSVEECLDKIGWLLDHEGERVRIAAAGKARCLRDHTFDRRAERLNEIIRRSLR